MTREYEQNQERYRFPKWGQKGFSNFRVVPPRTGICHQVNLEYLALTVWTAKEKRNGKTVEVAFPDTLVGTDRHTALVNGLTVHGWGVGGSEADTTMPGQPLQSCGLTSEQQRPHLQHRSTRRAMCIIGRVLMEVNNTVCALLQAA